jgi:hypothetical protein
LEIPDMNRLGKQGGNPIPESSADRPASDPMGSSGTITA